MSDSCEFTSSEQRPQEDLQALLLKANLLECELERLQLLKAETLKSQLEDLQILNERLHGEGIDDLSSTELRSLDSQLQQGLVRVQEQLDKKTIEKEENEKRLVKQVERKVDPELRRQILSSESRMLNRKRAREQRNSSEGIQDWDDHIRVLESMERMRLEIKESQLWIGRMCGKDIDGLDYYELMALRREIKYGRFDVWYWIVRKQWQERARLGKPIFTGRKKSMVEKESL